MAATISGVGHWLPPHQVSSTEVEQRVNLESAPYRIPPGLVKLVSGVAERRYADPPLSSADLAARSATAALADCGADPSDVDLLIFASASSALLEPATANIVQELTGCSRARVFDLKNACNSFVDALDVAQSLVETGGYRRALVAAGEVNSPAVSWRIEDRAQMNHRLAALTLGDAGAACIVEWTDHPDHRILPGHFQSDGTSWRLSVVMSGGTILRHDMSRLHLDCDTIALQKAGQRLVPPVVERALRLVDWKPDDVALIVPHQVSDLAIDSICDAAGLDPSRCTRTLRRYGNTAAASIPLGLSLAKEEGQLERGDKVLLVGVSAGLSVGVLPLVWSLP